MYQPVCILIMAHSHEELLLNLLNRLAHPMVAVYVHIDKKSGAMFDNLAQRPGIRLIQNRVDVQWAHISQVQAVFSSYREIVAAGAEFGHFLVISGQDYPLHSMEKLVSFLAAHPGKSFVSYAPLTRQGWAAARKRYRYYYYIRGGKFWRGLMMLTGLRRKFPLGLEPFGGSQWINLAKKHMDFILAFCETHPELLAFLQTARFPEEMLFQTLMQNSEYRDACVNNDLRFVKWLPGKSNPEILDSRYLPEIRQANEKFFARKMDARQSAELITILNAEAT